MKVITSIRKTRDFVILISTIILLYVLIFSFSSQKIYDNLLIDYDAFKYVINNDMCNNYDSDLLAIILVTSYVGNQNIRIAHRKAISQAKLGQMNILRIFLIAEPPRIDESITQEQIYKEQLQFNDLVQGNFIDSFRNYSYKTGMGFKWTVAKCSKAKYVIKTGDDTVFNIYYIKKFLETFEVKIRYAPEFVAGYVHTTMKIEKRNEETFFVSLDEDDYENYPYFLLELLYISNPWTVKQLIIASQTTEYYGIENAYFTGILRSKINCKLYYLNNWFTKDSNDIYTCVNDMNELGQLCYYYVGPNDGDNELLAIYLKAIENCIHINCVDRMIK